eukprot:COSAG02_NODE_99_length_37069_cov_24.910957_17_plen_213_part_00
MVRSQRLGAGRCFVRIERVINHLYYYCMYEFVGQNPRTQGREVLFQVSEFLEPIGMFHRNFPWARSHQDSTHTRTHTRIRDPHPRRLFRFPSKHSQRLQFPVPNSMCPGWLLRDGPRAAARAAAREPPGSDVYRSSSTIAARVRQFLGRRDDPRSEWPLRRWLSSSPVVPAVQLWPRCSCLPSPVPPPLNFLPGSRPTSVFFVRVVEICVWY